VHEIKLLFSPEYRRQVELEELLTNFEVTSPPFTRPIFYRHKYLRAPVTVSFEVSTEGTLRINTNLSAIGTEKTWLHLDSGDIVFHLPLNRSDTCREGFYRSWKKEGEFQTSPEYEDHRNDHRQPIARAFPSITLPPPPDPPLPYGRHGISDSSKISRLRNLAEKLPLQMSWQHTKERSPNSEIIQSGRLSGDDAIYFQHIHTLWLTINEGVVDVDSAHESLR
jgi:hypothetical protein